MNRNEAKSKTIDILLGDQNPNVDFYYSLFERYNYDNPENTPISPAKMGNVNANNNVVVTEEAYRELIKIRNITLRTNNEVAFLIFGEEKPNGTVWLDTVISSYQSSSRTVANFDGINAALNKYVKDIAAGEYRDANKQVVCHGHTHGTSPVCANFSFGDLISYVELNNSHPLFRSKQVGRF